MSEWQMQEYTKMFHYVPLSKIYATFDCATSYPRSAKNVYFINDWCVFPSLQRLCASCNMAAQRPRSATFLKNYNMKKK